MSAKQSRSRRARFESLEPKALLAGDVLVSVVEGQLVVHGDELGNQIVITAGPEPGSFVVQGLDGTNVILQPPPMDPAGQPGEASASAVVVHGVRGSARIGMGDGDDRVVLRDARFQGDVNIRMGLGEDQLIVGPAAQPMPEVADDMPLGPSVGIAGSLRIGTGEGSDRVHVGHAAIRGALNVVTFGGDDSVVLGQPPMNPPAEPLAAVDVNGTSEPMMPPAALNVGRGIHVRLGQGNDSLLADLVHSAGGLHADGGLGDDRLSVHASRIGRSLALFGGEGHGIDRIVLDHVSAGVAAIMTGAGNDNVRIVDSLFHLLGVGLGEGDDTLAIAGNKAELAVLLGGDGEDTLLGLRNNRFRRLVVHGFELPAMDGGGSTA